LLKGQEGERARLAKELHDSVGNNLSFIKSETLRLAHDNVYLISLISQTAEDVRSITHNLMPTVIRKFGLVQGLKDLVDKWQRNSTVLVDLNVDHNIKRYDENIELAIFRIVQELTSNAIKHGESNYILIEIKTKPDGLHMLFEDNGNGFDVENATQTGGLGFQNINNRVAFLNGEMSASSTSSGSKFLFLFKVFPL
jgi:signal transduction histidine kinase